MNVSEIMTRFSNSGCCRRLWLNVWLICSVMLIIHWWLSLFEPIKMIFFRTISFRLPLPRTRFLFNDLLCLEINLLFRTDPGSECFGERLFKCGLSCRLSIYITSSSSITYPLLKKKRLRRLTFSYRVNLNINIKAKKNIVKMILIISETNKKTLTSVYSFSILVSTCILPDIVKKEKKKEKRAI